MKREEKTGIIKTPPIAIVGIGSFFPDARTVQEFWSNILNKKDSVIANNDFPGYWDREDFYDPDPKSPDKTYAFKAAFIPKIDFEPMEFRIPPKTVEAISIIQLYTLYVARFALQDAGMLDPKNNKVDRDKVGVILGIGGQGNTGYSLGARSDYPAWGKVLKNSGLPEKMVNYLVERMKDLYVEWQEASFPGFLTNVVAGRVGSYYDLGGTNCTIDAACASSLAAIKMSISELAEGSCDAVLTGGANVENSIFSFLCFSKTPALSRTNRSRPYDADCDGMMLGDGLGLMVLKRLEDAERDNDKIYAVIKGIGASGDGRAKSIFAPRFEGQVKAMNRAYEKAGVTPGDIQLLEGHGTGTVAGDQTEFKSLKHVYSEAKVPLQQVALGSIKSQVGHSRSAAGAASMVKTALALHHKVLPPTINVDKPNPTFEIEQSAFYLNTEARPWIRSKNQSPRRAALSAFGFGGTNFHVILEEYQREHKQCYRKNHVPDVMLIEAASPDALLAKCKDLLKKFKSDRGRKEYYDYVMSIRNIQIPVKSARIGFVSGSVDEAIDLLTTASNLLEKRQNEAWDHPKGIYYKPKGEKLNGKVAALFPGQGSQFVNMASKCVQNYPEMREIIGDIDQVMEQQKEESISKVIFPIPVFNEQDLKVQNDRLMRTKFAQAAIGGISAGYYRILNNAGFKPDYIAGHSFGELTALWAAGAMDDQNFYELAVARGKAMDIPEGSKKDTGGMIAVFAPLDEINNWLKDFPDLKIANYNSSDQTVLGGSTDSINKLNDKLKKVGKRSVVLSVSAAFHTPFVEHAVKPFAEKLEKVQFKKPSLPVYANTTGQLYTDSLDEMKSTLAAQLLNPVHFTQIVSDLYQKGVRYFIEIGPKAVLGKLVNSILKDKEHKVISVNSGPSKDDEVQLRQAFTQLLVAGIQINHFDPYEIKDVVEEPRVKKLAFELNGGYFIEDPANNKRDIARYKKDDTVFNQCIDELVEGKTKEIIQGRVEELVQQRAQKLAGDMAEKMVQEKLKNMDLSNIKTQSANTAANNQPAMANVVLQSGAAASGPAAISASSTDKSSPASVEDPVKLQESINEQIKNLSMINEVHEHFQKNHNKYMNLLNNAINHKNSISERFKDSPQLEVIMESLNKTFNLLEANQDNYHANHNKFFDNQTAFFSSAPPAGSIKSRAAIQSQPAKSAAIMPGKPVQGKPVIQEEPGDDNDTNRLNRLLNESLLEGVESSNTPVIKAETPAISPVQPAVQPITAKPVTIQSKTPSPNSSQFVAIGSNAAAPAAQTKTVEKTADSTAKTGTSSAASDSSQPGIKDFTEKLLNIVSEKTGYPPEMIDLDMDLEADMGIDSIKRVEIIGTLFEGYDDQNRKLDDMDSLDLDDFKTLRSIIDFLKEKIVAQPTTAGEAETAAVSKTISEPVIKDAALIDRFIIKKKALAKPDLLTHTLADGQIWVITDDGAGISQDIITQLKKQNQKAVVLSFPKDMIRQKTALKDSIVNYQLEDLTEEKLKAVIRKITDKEGAIGGFIHIHPAAEKIDQIKGGFSDNDYQIVKKIFFIAKELQPVLNDAAQKGRAAFITVTQIDGELGTADRNGYQFIGGGLTGLTKSLHREWSNVFCRHIDLDPRLSKKNTVQAILEELMDSQSGIAEIGINNKLDRCTITMEKANAAIGKTGPAPQADSVFFVSGGGRGITARCAIDMAKAFKCRFVLAGRTDISGNEPQWAARKEDENSLKMAAISEMKKNNEQPTPVKIEKMLKSITSRREISQTIREIENAGGKAVYISADIVNQEQLKLQIEKAEKELGKVSGIIHGAGNLADKKIEKKTEADFESVFGTKIKGLNAILNAIDPNQVQYFVLFSSVAGFFGNGGQTDYAMANEVLNKFAYSIKTINKNIFVKSINWGPWDSGMVNPTLKKFYKEKNIQIIPIPVGTQYCVKELSSNLDSNIQTLVCGGIFNPSDLQKPNVNAMTIKRELLLDNNVFLNDHVVGGNPVLPATCAINWMIKSCEDMLTGYHFAKVENFKVLKGVIFDEKVARDFTVRLNPIKEKSDPDKGYLVIETKIESNSNKKLPNYHYSAVIHLSTFSIDKPIYQNMDLAKDGKLTEKLYINEKREGILFHGKMLQGVREVLNSSELKMTSLCRLPALDVKKQGQYQVNSFNPYIADVQLHNNILWLFQFMQEGGLPSAFGAIDQFEKIDFDQEFYVSTEITTRKDDLLVTDIIVHDDKGAIYQRWKDVEFTITPKLKELFWGKK